MSGKAKPKIYWDACIFLSWIQQEGPPKRKAGDMEGVARVAKLVSRGEMLLFTSVITHTEVLASKMDPVAKKRYSDVFERPEVIEIAVDNPISVLASEIRDFYFVERDKLPENERKKALTVSTPDAIHLATAIYYGAEEFHTFDGDNTGRPDGLLRLGDTVATYKLKVRKPDDQQLSLLLNVPALPDPVLPLPIPIDQATQGEGPKPPATTTQESDKNQASKAVGEK